MCWVELHYGTVCFFFGGGSGRILTSFLRNLVIAKRPQTVPRCTSTLPRPSVTFNLKIADINCGGEGWRGPWGEGENFENVSKSE